MNLLQEELQQKAKREARLKKIKDEYGSARWRAKRKVTAYVVPDTIMCTIYNVSNVR